MLCFLACVHFCGSSGLGGLLLEFLNAACCVYELLLARVERMAVGAQFNTDRVFGGSGGELHAAGAGDLCLWVIGWVGVDFHKIGKTNAGVL